jgi:hypothetical protein
MPDDARITVVGDWGTGMYGAPKTARTIAGLGDQYFMQLHLGDIYYSGTPTEVTGRFLNVWQKRPEAIRLSPKSDQGAVLIRVPIQPFTYALQFSKNGKSGFLSRVYIMKIDAAAPGYRYIARTLSPGRYRLDNVWQQGAWTACMEQGTFEFTIEPGKIAYLGTFEVDGVLREIQSQAVERGKTVVYGTDYMQGQAKISDEMVTGRDPADLAEARRFADSSMNGSGALVALADVGGTSFKTSGFNKSIKICG